MKIICIGRNYAEHAKELGNNIPNDPIFFLKPETAIQPKGHPFFIPFFSNEIHYEVELVIKICKSGKHIEKRFAYKYYTHIGLGIDFTARDVQLECKKKGLPWEKAKSFDGSARISDIFLNKDSIELNNINFTLLKNDIKVQQGNSNEMINNFDEIISYISKFITLKIGDLVYTGTPKGVGVVKKGDVLSGFIGQTNMLNVKVK